MTLIIFALLHILCCLLVFLGIALRFLKVRKLMVLIALFMPVWGPVLVLALHLQIQFGQIDKTVVGVEDFKIDSELYKGINYDDANDSSTTVSMEEALIVNTPKERRKIIMSILNDNPKAYVEFLKMAGNNDDTEVVHYAVSAMVQIAKENDQTLWDFEQRYSQNPEDPETVEMYCEFLWHCLEQGLMQGQIERMNRNLYDTLIRKKISIGEPLETDYIRCVENGIALENYTEAGVMIEKARNIWPDSEELLILKIQYLADLQRAGELEALLRELEEKNVYLSSRLKEVIAFWRD